MHESAHPQGELATAQGAHRAGIGLTLSIHAAKPMEEVAVSSPNVLRFMQMYIMADKGFTLSLIRRAEQCGYKAIVLTVDTPVYGNILENKRNKFLQKLPEHLRSAYYITSRKSLDVEDSVSISKFSQAFTWDDLKWLKSVTDLPIVLKGILTAEDAQLAVSHGVAGILVSNHGGRQLDTALSAIDALPEVVAAVNGRCQVYMDGGVRNGTDIFKALALGAKAVFVGRPVVYALAYNGAQGVSDMIDILKSEFSNTMALAGCPSVGEIKREMVVHEWHHKARL